MVTPGRRPARACALPAHGVGSRQDLPLPFDLLAHRRRPGPGHLVRRARRAVARAAPAAATDGRLAAARRSPSRWTPRSCARSFGVAVARPDRLDPARAPRRRGRRQQPRAVRRLRLAVGRASALLSMVFGPIWRVLNPIRWLHRGHARRVARVSPDFAPGPLPPRLLACRRSACSPSPGSSSSPPTTTTLPVLRVAILGFMLVSLVLALVFGRDWFDTGDPFEAWSGLLRHPQPAGPPRRPPLGRAHTAARPQPARPRAGAAGHASGHAGRHGLRRVLRRDLVVHLRAVLGPPGPAVADRSRCSVCPGGGR